MYPEKFIQRISSQHYIDSEVLLKALKEPSPVSIRINPVKWNNTPENCEPVAWCRNGFYIRERPSFTLDPLFHAGCYYPQEASGMFLEQVFRQINGDRKNIRVLDLCGAPGGKSTHLSELICNNGFLVANEVIKTRASVLAENLTKWGLSNAIVTQSDPSAFSRLGGFFDVMLIDAPCSGEGMFNNQIAINEWSEDNAFLCCERQKRILSDAWPSLKEEGILIYSTCTFNPDENERNIKWLAEKHEAETVKLDVTGFEGITVIDYKGIEGYGFYPGRTEGEGLFISVLRKKDKNRSANMGKPQGRERKPGKNEINIIAELTYFSEDSSARINDELISIPCSNNEYAQLSGSLKIIKSGTKVCTLKKKNYVPSHELAMSVYLRKSVFNTLNIGYADALSYLRRDNIRSANAPSGWNIASYEGVNLGFINNIGYRLNNYYPVEWRIRMSVQDTELKSIRWGKTATRALTCLPAGRDTKVHQEIKFD